MGWIAKWRLGGTLALFSFAGALAGCGHHLPRRVVLVVIDTLRRDHLSCYGSSTTTPNIDALASGGTIFANAVASYHQTTMSMAALFTGRVPSIESTVVGQALPWDGHTWCGLARFGERDADGACVPASVPTLAAALRTKGYTTVGIVSNSLLFRPAGYDQGFDQWIEVGREGMRPAAGASVWAALWRLARARAGTRVNLAVQKWLRTRQADRVFLYVHYMDVHDWSLLGIPYASGVKNADRAFGELHRLLGEAGLLEDAIVVLTADHGEALNEVHALPAMPRHFGNPSFQPVLEVPLIVWPAVDEDSARLVRTDDTFRLLRRLAGVPDRRPHELESDELFLTERVFRTYRRDRWKSMWNRVDGIGHLFDLAEDHGETRDVAADHPEELDAHRRRIDELSRSVAAAPREARELAPEERQRLRALGYLE